MPRFSSKLHSRSCLSQKILLVLLSFTKEALVVLVLLICIYLHTARTTTDSSQQTSLTRQLVCECVYSNRNPVSIVTSLSERSLLRRFLARFAWVITHSHVYSPCTCMRPAGSMYWRRLSIGRWGQGCRQHVRPSVRPSFVLLGVLTPDPHSPSVLAVQSYPPACNYTHFSWPDLA